ncbi:unnamed protein product [Schistosoma turkestanicum]|nr:unnamed protein product [Schistosoma turkestanicum]
METLSLSDEDVQLKKQFNDNASNILFEKAIRQHEEIRKLQNTFPNLHLKCTCDCRPPLIKIKNSEMNINAKITVADISDCSMPCYTPYYTMDSSSYNFTTFWLGLWSICCALSTLITILTFLIDSYRFQYPELPLIYLTICYFMISIGYLIRVIMGHQAIACDSLSNPYDVINTHTSNGIINNNNNDNNNNWYNFDKTNEHLQTVTRLPGTTTITPKDITMKILPTLTATTVAAVTTTTTTTATTTSTSTSSNIIISDLFKSINHQLIRSKVLRYAITGRISCAAVFLLIYFFSMSASIWRVILSLTCLLGAGFKWGSQSISKYSPVFHFIAWSLPASQTALALLLSVVEGDPISGLCTITSNKSRAFLFLIFTPLLIYLSIGIILMIIGFIALFRIRGTIKLQRPNFVETQKLDKLIIRIGVFGMLYAIPNLIILFSIGYELRDTHLWQLGVACHCYYDIGEYKQQENSNDFEPILPVALPAWNPPKPEYAVFMLKHFMSLIIGITSGFWIWSNKTIESWRRFCFNSKCFLFKFNKHHSGSGLLVNPIGIDQEIGCQKRPLEHWIHIPPTVSMQSVSKLNDTRIKSMLKPIQKYPMFIDNNEQCQKNLINTTDFIPCSLSSNPINPLVTLSNSPSTPFSAHPYDVPIHDRHYKSSFGAYYSIDGSTISQQYGDVNSYHTNNSFSDHNNTTNNNHHSSNGVVDKKFCISNTKSFTAQSSSGHSMNLGFSTLSSSLNSPHKSSIPQLNNNNHLNNTSNTNNNHNNNNGSSISTGISSSGIGSDGLPRTTSTLTGCEFNSNSSISPKFIDHYLNGDQRSYGLIGTPMITMTTTTTTASTTTILPIVKYDRYMNENNMRRDNHCIAGAYNNTNNNNNNQFFYKYDS